MAAFEVEPATQSIYVNCWKEEKTLTPEVAGRRLRGAVTDAIKVGSFASSDPDTCASKLLASHKPLSTTLISRV